MLLLLILFSQVSLGKFGTFSSNNLIDKPFGLSYEIYDQKGNIRPVRNWALATVGMLVLLFLIRIIQIDKYLRP